MHRANSESLVQRRVQVSMKKQFTAQQYMQFPLKCSRKKDTQLGLILPAHALRKYAYLHLEASNLLTPLVTLQSLCRSGVSIIILNLPDVSAGVIHSHTLIGNNNLVI